MIDIALAAALFAGAVAPRSGGAVVPGNAEYLVGRALAAPPDRVAYDTERRVVVVSTGRSFHLVSTVSPADASKPLPKVTLEGEGASVTRLKPAPGGGVVLAIEAGRDLTRRITIHDLDGHRLGAIVPDPGARAFQAVLVGYRGTTIATCAEEVRATGAARAWRWALWSARGERLGAFSVSELPKAAFDPSGRRLLVILSDRVEVRERNGEVHETVQGRFAKGDLSEGGETLMLGMRDNPSSFVVARRGRVLRFDAAKPVAGVAASPDGRHGAIWSSDGTVQVFDERRGVLGPSIPPPVAGSFSVSSLAIESGGRITLGLFASRDPGRTGENGWLVRIENGAVAWYRCFPALHPAPGWPAVLPPAEGRIPAWNLDRFSLLVTPTPGTRWKRSDACPTDDNSNR
jgi:hypothetical protein